MQRIQADENRRQVTVFSLAAGTMKKQDRSRVWNEWAKMSRGRRRVPLSREQQEHVLAAIGIKLEWRKN